MPVEVMVKFEKVFNTTVFEGYGLSETSPVASFNMPGQPTKSGTIGVAIPGCEMKLIDEDGKDVGPGGVGEIAQPLLDAEGGPVERLTNLIEAHVRRLARHR